MTSQEVGSTDTSRSGTPTPGGTPGGSKLDNATKEDLIKLLKKQQIGLKKHQAEAAAVKERATKAVSAARSELSTATEQVSLYKTKYEKLQEELNNIEDVTQEEIQQLQHQIKTMSNDREDLVSEVETLRHNKESMRSILQNSASVQDELESKVKQLTLQLETEVHEREQEREGWKSHIQELEVAMREREAEERARAAEENKAELKEDLAESKSQISSLRNEGEELKSMMLEYNQQFQAETQTLSQALELLNNPGLMRQREDIEAELRALNEELTECQAQLLSKDDHITDLTAQLSEPSQADELRSEVLYLKETIGQSQAVNYSLREEVDKANQAISSLSGELSECQEELAQSKVELEAAQSKVELEAAQNKQQDEQETKSDECEGQEVVPECNPGVQRVEELERRIEEMSVLLADKEDLRQQSEAERGVLEEKVTQLTEQSTEERTALEERIAGIVEEKRNLQLHLETFLNESITLKEQSQSQEELALVEDREVYSQALVAKEEELVAKDHELVAKDHELIAKDQELIAREEELVARAEELETARQQIAQLEDQLLTLQEVSSSDKAGSDYRIEELQSHILSLEEEMSRSEDEREGERAELHSQIFLLEEQISALNTKVAELEGEIEGNARCIEEREAEVLRLTEELQTALDENKSLVEDTKGSNSLMDMELADYQRAITALEEKLKTMQQAKHELEGDVKRKEELLTLSVADVKQLEKQRSQHDEMITKLKALLIKTKKESADSKRLEEEMRRSEQGTKKELEFSNQKLEELKLEFSEVTSKLSSVTESSRTKGEENLSVIRSLEHRLSSVQEDIVRERKVRDEISVDFDSYKVRVHSVLKQQKTKESVISVTEHDAITTQLSREAELAKCSLHEAKMLEEVLKEERDGLESELTLVIGKLDKLEKDSTERETFYLDKVLELETCLKEKEEQLSSAIQSAAAQRSSLTDSYTKTIEHNNISHKEALELLQSRIDQLTLELKAEQDTALRVEESEERTIETLRGSIRLGAEGMESPAPAQTPFEDLINSSFSRTSSRVSIGGDSTNNNTTNAATMEEWQTSHLTKLLTESEHSAAALQEQCTVLKQEVRRSDQMIAREDTNIEYLKNVVLKFLCSDVAAREHLVPVLCTVLKLNKDEKALISDSAGRDKREAVPWSTGWFSSS